MNLGNNKRPGLKVLERESANAISHCHTVHWGINIDVFGTIFLVSDSIEYSASFTLEAI